MSYIINNYRGNEIATVDDGTVNTQFDLKLIGKDAPYYGEIQNENFVFLLENFAMAGTTDSQGNVIGPVNPLQGQTWFDVDAKTLRVYDGTHWKAIGGVQVGATEPSGSSAGDLWYNSTKKQMFMWDGTAYTLLGPNRVDGKGPTTVNARGVYDVGNAYHAVIEGYVDGQLMFLVSKDPTFTLSASEVATYNNRISTVYPGINLVNTNTQGVTTSTVRFRGTATDSDKLGGQDASNYLLKNNLQFDDIGFTVGNDSPLRVSINSGIPTFANQTGNTLSFSTFSNNATNTPLTLVDNNILPGNTNSSTNIGSSSAKFSTVYALTFNGTATKADSLNVSGTYVNSSVSTVPSTVVVRDGFGNINANVFNGVATSARFADLAEKYLTDMEYDVGTVMMVGGTAEVTASVAQERAIGVISGSPAYMMNCDLVGGQYVALKGRVPVKVVGKVNKGDSLIAHENGTAIASRYGNFSTFAIALESNDHEELKLVEAIIL